MPLPLPNLDDRDFDELLQMALDRIKANLNTDWSDLTPGDPGIVLLDAFCFLTDYMLYRLNRLPEKAYIAFLRLLGVTLAPPRAARVELEFRRTGGAEARPIRLPIGTRVGAEGGANGTGEVVFITAHEVTLPATEGAVVRVPAYHCDWVEEELGEGDGTPGRILTVRRPPIVAPMRNELDLLVGVEAPGDKAYGDWHALDGNCYRRWTAVEDFAESDSSSRVYVVDRQSGAIQFMPGALLPEYAKRTQADPGPSSLGQRGRLSSGRLPEAVPNTGHRIRIRYACGGGEVGNVAPGKLTQLLDAPAGEDTTGVVVTNPRPARGGRDAEPLESALARGPYEAFSRKSVVTARDFEQAAVKRGEGIARAYAYARHSYWRHAQPGTVEIALVPFLPHARRRPTITKENLRDAQDQADVARIRDYLQEHGPLGTCCEPVWARYKQVQVQATVAVCEEAQREKVEESLTQRLNELISPLSATSDAAESGWPFGQKLTMTQMYRTIMDDNRVSSINRLALVVDAPHEKVYDLAADYFQPHTWYAASDSRLFRSINDGAGWELMLSFSPREAGDLFFPASSGAGASWQRRAAEARPDLPLEQISIVRPSPDRPGLVALATIRDESARGRSSALYLSPDCGESWFGLIPNWNVEVRDMAWMVNGGRTLLLLATSSGLFVQDIKLDLSGQPEMADMPRVVRIAANQVDPGETANLPVNAVAVLRHSGNRVAVATGRRQGVFLSCGGDMPPPAEQQWTFEFLGLAGQDVRTLGVQTCQGYGARSFLWAGAMAVGDWVKGCYRWQFDGPELVSYGQFVEGWTAGSCYALAFDGLRAFAATGSGGVWVTELNPDEWHKDRGWTQLEPGHLPRRLSWIDRNDRLRPGTSSYLQPLVALAAGPPGWGGATGVIMAGGEAGVFRWRDRSLGGPTTDVQAGLRWQDQPFEPVSRTELNDSKDAVTIPSNWLLVSGAHVICAVSTGDEEPLSRPGLRPSREPEGEHGQR